MISLTPCVTIITPVFNASAYLSEALDSMIAQTYENWELLICDDGSDDDSPRIARTYASQDQRIRLLTPGKVGLSRIRNVGLEQAKGSYIALMDSDDLSLPLRLEKQLRFLEEHPDVGALGGQALTINADGCQIGTWNVSCDHATIDHDHIEGWRVQMIQPSVMLRTAVLRQLGGYRENQPVEDIDLWLRLAEVTRLANLPDVLIHYRVLGTSYSNSSPLDRGKDFTLTAMEARQRRGLPFVALPPPFWVDPRPRDPYDRAVHDGRQAQAVGDWATARRLGLSLLRQRPWSKRAWSLLLPHLGQKQPRERP